MWMVSVTGNCKYDGTPVGAYTVLKDSELFDWLDEHGWLDGDAYLYIDTEWRAHDLMKIALEDGSEGMVGILDTAKRYVFNEMTQLGVIHPRSYGLIGRRLYEREIINMNEEE